MMHRQAMTELAQRGVAIAENQLAPDVVRILFSLGEDWTGEPAVFFRILLSDPASERSRLREVAHRAQDYLQSAIDSEELGFHSYSNYRSASEQAQLKDPDWEPAAHPKAPALSSQQPATQKESV